jgi:hypothetical protein
MNERIKEDAIIYAVYMLHLGKSRLLSLSFHARNGHNFFGHLSTFKAFQRSAFQFSEMLKQPVEHDSW